MKDRNNSSYQLLHGRLNNNKTPTIITEKNKDDAAPQLKPKPGKTKNKTDMELLLRRILTPSNDNDLTPGG